MNKLQQEIIEIIEPYMDKTLSEGCLISWIYQGKVFIEKYLDENSQGIITLEELIDEKENQYFKLGAIIENHKIIGHYDITAVLKYIDMSYRDSRGIPQGNILVELTQGHIHINIGEELYMIPNKPLHLYSDEENKHLLKLLKELGNKN